MADEMKKPCSNTLYPLRPVSKPSNIINKPGDLHSCVSQIITRCIRRFFQLICHCYMQHTGLFFLKPCLYKPHAPRQFPESVGKAHAFINHFPDNFGL